MTSAPDGAYAERRTPDYDSYPPKSEMPLDQLITTFLQTLLVQSSVLVRSLQLVRVSQS